MAEKNRVRREHFYILSWALPHLQFQVFAEATGIGVHGGFRIAKSLQHGCRLQDALVNIAVMRGSGLCGGHRQWSVVARLVSKNFRGRQLRQVYQMLQQQLCRFGFAGTALPTDDADLAMFYWPAPRARKECGDNEPTPSQGLFCCSTQSLPGAQRFGAWREKRGRPRQKYVAAAAATSRGCSADASLAYTAQPA